MLDVAEQAGQMPRLADLGAGFLPAAAQTVSASGNGGIRQLYEGARSRCAGIEAMAVTEFPPPPHAREADAVAVAP